MKPPRSHWWREEDTKPNRIIHFIWLICWVKKWFFSKRKKLQKFAPMFFSLFLFIEKVLLQVLSFIIITFWFFYSLAYSYRIDKDILTSKMKLQDLFREQWRSSEIQVTVLLILELKEKLGYSPEISFISVSTAWSSIQSSLNSYICWFPWISPFLKQEMTIGAECWFHPSRTNLWRTFIVFYKFSWSIAEVNESFFKDKKLSELS